ncbi:hypothetical protein GOP47_0020690 [Adiantum capillus-veneris]|uniref:N6-adenosine-methyltransferase MT-A70-like n=1 Tax=Adiantum capillus-veneris TaxID=13818 RepID=A0A9D4UA67_ADICA|nr:hypothetical protein GOP47_0020690 [Adiantum capillus-veneris]
MEGDEETEELIVMREQRRQLREQLASQRKARLELINSLQHLVPELVSSLELSLKVVSSFSGKESHSSHSSGKQSIASQLDGLPLPPDSTLPGLAASLSTPRSTKPDPSSTQHGRGDSETVHMAAPAGKAEEKWELDKDFGSDNKGPDAALAVVKKLIASCLLSPSTSVPIDSAGLHRRLPKDLSSAAKSALLEIGGDRGGIAAVEAALQAFADENAGVELEEFTVSGKTRLMVLGIDRNRLAKELPAPSSQPKASDELAHNSGATGLEISGGSFAMSPMPARSADVWGLGGDIHMHAPPLPGSGPHIYPGGGAPPMMGPRVGPRMIGMHGIPPAHPAMGLGYGGMPGNMQRPALGAPQVPATGGKVRGSSEEDITKDLEAMLAKKSFRELQKSKTGEELLDLLHRPTAKETAVAEKFKTKGGSVLKEYCPNLTKEDCRRQRNSYIACDKVHFRRIIAVHTDVNLGDCSFLDTCRHMKTCKYVHYELDPTPDVPGIGPVMPPRKPLSKTSRVEYCSEVELGEPQWINCDIRTFRMDILGQFGVIMADPPWDIHMELPYGTMADDEMRSLNVPALQTDGLIFLWVTGRAMELGRECLELWGYRRVEELIWVKTNQLQRIIRTGRTGHWLNHSKEHCLVGIKGQPEVNRNIDTDVLVAEVRETSRKPDEMYPMLERISPRTRKLELFARMHNTHAGWISLGNQLNGVRLVDEGLRARHIINARQVLRPSVQVVAGWYPLFLTYLGRVKKATRGVQTRCS